MLLFDRYNVVATDITYGITPEQMLSSSWKAYNGMKIQNDARCRKIYSIFILFIAEEFVPIFFFVILFSNECVDIQTKLERVMATRWIRLTREQGIDSLRQIFLFISWKRRYATRIPWCTTIPFSLSYIPMRKATRKLTQNNKNGEQTNKDSERIIYNYIQGCNNKTYHHNIQFVQDF